MNIYDLHTEPKSLLHYDIANETIPKLFWKKYKDNLEELKKREKYIAKDAQTAYYYARFILKGPFPAGEETISKNTEYSYWYACVVLKGQFHAGEEAISKDKYFLKLYLKLLKKQVLSNREKEKFKKKFHFTS